MIFRVVCLSGALSKKGKALFFKDMGRILGIIAALYFTFLGFSSDEPDVKADRPVLEAHVISINDRYGYEISRDNRVLIRQTYIPAVGGKRSFETSKEAEQVAKLVKQKLLKGLSPVISIDELKALNISISPNSNNVDDL